MGFVLIKSLSIEANGLNDPNTDWVKPVVMSIKQTGLTSDHQNEPYYFNNLDCTLVEYRQAGSSQMKTGCFSNTAYGMIDTDTYMTIFNGTDEAIQLLPLLDKGMLVPWPQTTNTLTLSPYSTDGVLLAMYNNPLNNIKDNRNLLGQIISKQITAPPEVALDDGAGKKLIINPQTIAFSSNGSWLVAETLSGSFVRLNLNTLDVLAFAPSFSRLGSPGLLSTQVAISDNGKYVALSNAESGSFKVYDLGTCSGGVAATSSGFCQSYDYKPYIKKQIPQLSSIRHVRFINSGLLSFEAQSYASNASGKYLLAPESSIDSLTNYIGLGDSYTSGEGAYDYVAGTDSDTNKCHLSIRSHPYLLTADLFGVNGGHSVACSGAVINDVASNDDSYRGQVSGVANFSSLEANDQTLLGAATTNFLPGYIAQQRFVKQYQPKVTTVSIGGNDVGFGDILQNCTVPHFSRHLSDSTCFNTYEDRLELKQLVDRTIPKWKSLFLQLKNNSPSGTVYAVGYPSIVADKGNCGLNTHLNKSELEFADEMVSYINEGMSKAAAATNTIYVDISDSLVGYRLCEVNWAATAVNGLTAGKDGGPLGIGVFGSESYHPNALGQRLMEQSILSKTNNFSKALAPNPSKPSKLLNAPKTGRKTYVKIPSKNITSKVVRKGKSTKIKVSGLSSGTKKNSSYSIKLGGPGGKSVGTATTDQNGDIDITINLPDDTDSGGTTIDIIGDNQGNDQVDITQPIYVPVTDTDIDGDGINDAQDSCPAAINSGIDEDHDGIDDVCDSIFNKTTSNTDVGRPTVGTNTVSNGSDAPKNTASSKSLTVSSQPPEKAQKINKSSAVLAAKKINNQKFNAQHISRPKNKYSKKYSKPVTTIFWWQIILSVLIIWFVSYSLVSVKNRSYKYMVYQ